MKTAVYHFCTLQTPFDIVFNAVSNYGYNPERSLPKIHAFQMCSYLGPQRVKIQSDPALSLEEVLKIDALAPHTLAHNLAHTVPHSSRLIPDTQNKS